MWKKFKKKIFKFLEKNKTGISLFILFILSRLPFINANDVLFDSKEYIGLFSSPNLMDALTKGHTPLHELYVFFFWTVFHISAIFIDHPTYLLILVQIFLATFTIFFFYKCISFIANKDLALISTIIISLTPLFWITNVTITLETTYLTFFFSSLFLLTRYLQSNKTYFLHFSLILLAISILTYSALLLWLPVYIAFVFYKKKKEFIKISVLAFLYIIICITLRLLILSGIFHSNPLTLLHNMYLSNTTQVGNMPTTISGIFIFIRNFIPSLRNYSTLVVLLGFVSLTLCFFKNKKFFFIGLIWVLPALYINQWWDSVLMGRYSILAGFGFAFLAGYFVTRYRLLAPFLIIYLLFISLPALNLLRSPAPYMKEEAFVKTLPKDSLLIESHFALPQLVGCCQITVLGVNRQDIGNEKIKKKINLYLKNKKPVFVSSAAISDPYGLYTGPYLHPLSLSYTNKFELESLLTEYTWKKYHVIDEKDNLIIYTITGHGNSAYPEVMNLRDHYRRLDYYDPLSKLGSLLYNKFTNNLSL